MTSDIANGCIGNSNGVQDCCDFIKLHTKNGVILNGLLLWADIQRKVSPENIWKEKAVKRFDNEEITEAKELLWRTAGDSILGKMVKRQGANKSLSECNDMCHALTSLSEKDSLPMFLCTGNIAAQDENVSSEVINTQLKTIKESINYILSCEKKDDRTQNEPYEMNCPPMESTRKESNPWSNGTATTKKTPDTKLDETNDENEWIRVEHRNNARKSWRQKANILRGTAKCESEMLSADIHLVVYGLAKHVTGLQLSRFIESKDIKILGYDILTKYEGARSISFKITIRSCDYEKITNSDIWPIGVGIRQFKFFPRTDGKNVSDSQRNPKPILKKQVNNTPIMTPRINQNNMQRQYLNFSGMQNSMQGHPAMTNTWRPQPEILPRQVRFDGTHSHMNIMFKYGYKNVYLQ